jgi:RNA polymerase sigma-70 factor, ECF subfamily
LAELPAPDNRERREEAERIAVALANLPAHYEAVLRAKYLDQESVAAIAAAQGESIKAIESMLTRARQALREMFSGEPEATGNPRSPAAPR